MSRLLRPDACLSTYRLDQLMVGELPELARQATLAHVAACAQCTQRWQALVADREDFVSALPPLEHRRLALPLAAAVALAAALAVWLVPGSEPTTRLKGGPHLGFVVVHQGVARVSSTAQPGDTVVFTVSSASPTHVAIVSRDALGHAAVYYPAGQRAERIEGGQPLELPTATQLDSTLGLERLIGVFCARPFDLEPLRQALAEHETMAAPPGCVFDSLTLDKRP
jgi:anti-sigma factor RsiW